MSYGEDAMDGPEINLHTQGRLIGDLRQVIENAEELLKNTDHYSSTLYQGARARLTQALEAATEELARFEEAQLTRMIAVTHAASLLHHDISGEAKLMRAFRLP
jgi:ElaB/YqjD/DUF883 family membrane-anchored ribosome-binding protein